VQTARQTFKNHRIHIDEHFHSISISNRLRSKKYQKMLNCQAQIFSARQLFLKKCQIWHYKIPISKHVLRLQIIINAVVLDAMRGSYCLTVMDSTQKCSIREKTPANHGKCQNSQQCQNTWFPSIP